MSEVRVTFRHHVVEEGVFKLFPVSLAAEFDPDGVLDLHFQLPASIAECLEHIIGLSVAVIPTTFALRVDDDPVIASQVERLLNGKLPENLLIAVDESILTEDVRLAKDGSLFKLDRISTNFEAPVLGYLHFHEHLCHLLDLVDSLLRVDLGLHQSIAHVWAFADGLWDVCQETAFRRQEDCLTIGLAHKHGLPHVSDLCLIDGPEILGDADLVAISFEESVLGILFEVDPINDVGFLCSPVRHDALSVEFLADNKLPS